MKDQESRIKYLQRFANIICISGETGAGKSTFIEKHFPDMHRLSVSSIVRKITKKEKRTDLASTGHLHKKISSALNKEIAKIQSDGHRVVVDGIRQVEIFKMIESRFGGVEFVWLNVPKEVREDRIKRREAKRDKGILFADLEKLDEELGLPALKEYMMNKIVNISVIENYETRLHSSD